MTVINNLEEKKNVDICRVDKSTLTDIRDIKINPNHSINMRIENVLQQIENPYLRMIDGVAVKFSYADESISLTERIKDYVKGKFG